jgi:hypothetical protein
VDKSSDRDEVPPDGLFDHGVVETVAASDPAAHAHAPLLQRAARFEEAFGLLLICLVAIYIVLSLTGFHGVGAVFVTILGSLSATIALASARARPRLIVWGGRVAAAAVLMSIAGAAAPSKALLGVTGLVEVLLLGLAALVVLRTVVTETRVGFRTILGAVSVYLTIGLIFTFAYVSIDRLQGAPFFGAGAHVETGDYLFFSTTTLTTTGYGNLVPAAQPGKLFAQLEMLVGQIFLVTLIARLVTMWSPGEWLKERR